MSELNKADVTDATVEASDQEELSASGGAPVPSAPVVVADAVEAGEDSPGVSDEPGDRTMPSEQIDAGDFDGPIDGEEAPVEGVVARGEAPTGHGGEVLSEPGGEASNEPGAEAEAPVEDDAPSLDVLATTLAGLGDRLAESQRLLVRQGELADKLHAENQRLRAGELRAAMLPLVRDLLRLHDDIGRIAGEAERAEDLELMRISLLDALARNGIVAVLPTAGEQFDPKRHSAAGVIETDNASLDRSISEVIRLGFQWEDEQVIRVAEVRVCKYTPAREPSGSDAEALADTEMSADPEMSPDTELSPDPELASGTENPAPTHG